MRKSYISALNVLATFAVVLWHINDGVYYVNGGLSWYITVAVDSLVSFSVPCFFMITGANLIGFRDRGTTLKTYCSKRINKTFIPFLFWSLVFLVYFGYTDLCEILNSQGLGKMLLYSANSIISFKYYTAFWFFIDLFLIYVIIPFISLIPKNRRQKVLTIAVAFCVVVLFIFPNLLKLLGIEFINVFQGKRFLVFAIIGYLIDRYQIEKPWRILAYVLSIVAVLMHFFGTIAYSLPAGELSSNFRIKDGLISLIFTSGVFMLFKYGYKGKIEEKLRNAIAFFCRYSFSIYVLHIFVLNEILPRIGLNVYSSSTNHIVAYPSAFVLILAICIGTTWIFRKIPVLRRVLPE